MTKAEYAEYLRSPEWAKRRAAAFARYGHVCSRCGETRQLQVHHKTYKRILRERLSDLEILCSSCHKLEHKITEETETRDGRTYKVLRFPEAAPDPNRKPWRKHRHRKPQKPRRPARAKVSKFSKKLQAENDALHSLQQTFARRRGA